MIRLTGRVAPIWVNPAHIVSFTRHEDMTRVRLTTAVVIEVQEAPETILGRIRNAKRRRHT